MSDLPPPNAGIPRGIRPPPATRASRTSPNATNQLRRKIAEAFEGYTRVGAAALNSAGDTFSAEVWDQLGPKWAQDLSEVAMVNAQLRRILDRAADGGVYGAFIISSICMAAPVIGQWLPIIPDRFREGIAMIPVVTKRIDAMQYFAEKAAAAAAEAEANRNVNGSPQPAAV